MFLTAFRNLITYLYRSFYLFNIVTLFVFLLFYSLWTFLHFRGQSLKESASFTRFNVELSLKESERALLLEKRGAVYPKIPTWSGRLSRVQGGKGQLNVSVTWQGPSMDENVAKAIIEEFYEGCTWRYGRIRDASC